MKGTISGRGIRRMRFWILGVFLPAIGFILVLWAKHSEWASEYLFARGLTRILTVPLTFITNLVPFSVAEILLYCLILMVPIGLLVCCIRPRLRKWKRYGALLLSLIFWGFFLFQTLFVIQFGRRSLEVMLDYNTEDITAQELYQTALPLLTQANRLCDCIHYSEEGDSRYQEGMSREEGNRALLRHSYSGFSTVQDSMGLPLGGINARPKAVLASIGMSYAGITGIYIPFTGESNVNISIPTFDIPVTAAHEMAHQKGFSKEDEANYIALCVCMQDSDPYVQYSGYICAFRYVSNSLYRADKDLYNMLMSQLDERIRGEFRYSNQWWAKFEGKVNEVSTQINNTYLQASGSPGVISYGLVTKLLVGEYRQSGEA